MNKFSRSLFLEQIFKVNFQEQIFKVSFQEQIFMITYLWLWTSPQNEWISLIFFTSKFYEIIFLLA